MKASELRIGNYYTGSFGVMRVECVKSDGICKYNGEPILYVKPIPLTEEWLRKSGFELVPREGYSIALPLPNKRLYVSLSKSKEYRDARIIWHSEVLSISNQVDFVHQLQNLYFALTGEELPVRMDRLKAANNT